MDVQTLRRYRNTEPFKPFKIRLKDGRDLSVTRQFALAIAPDGSHMAFIADDSEVTRFKIDSVDSIQGLTGQASGSAA